MSKRETKPNRCRLFVRNLRRRRLRPADYRSNPRSKERKWRAELRESTI